MGGFLQAQAHLQLVSAIVDDGLDPQAALERPRFMVDGDVVKLEEGLWERDADLAKLGIATVRETNAGYFGGGQAILVVGDALVGGSIRARTATPAGCEGSVAWITIAPVKALALVHRDEVELEPFGVRENRRFYLVDEDGRLVNGKTVGPLVGVVPDYDAVSGQLALRFPDGSVVAGTVEHGEPVATTISPKARGRATRPGALGRGAVGGGGGRTPAGGE